MGTEQSKGRWPEMDGPPIEVTDSYVLNSAKLNGNLCSVFSGTMPSQSLTTLSNNLKTHRHPNIVKYVSSHGHDGRYYTVTEHVTPLFHSVAELTPLEICVGLHSIVTALRFLHTQAVASHNNVCCASIFVTRDGTWKLGGLEFMCKFSALSSAKLLEMSSRRYEPLLTPEERSGLILPAAVDVYGLGVLITELLTPHTTQDVPGLNEMMEFCRTKMLHPDPKSRATLAEIHNHSFFNHTFIRIHKFLNEIPLKSSEEKISFFRELESELKDLPESMVASQLINLLLARIVVIEPNAQNILPMLLRPKKEGGQDGSLFSESVFRQYVVPKILQMVCVRDTSVRLLLLTHLQSYITCFSKEQLQSQLLPELLVGIKDDSDELVAATLHALAFMVSRLGGAAVVGGTRARLFSDGRPATRTHRPESALPERPSPDGGEDSLADDTEVWSDWEQQSEKPVLSDEVTILKEETLQRTAKGNVTVRSQQPPVATSLADLDTLDVKNGGGWTRDQGPDFFSDMEPVISKSMVAVVATENDKFGVTDVVGATGDAWESFEDWGEN